MSESDHEKSKQYSRRDALKLSGMALGGLAVGGELLRAGSPEEAQVCPPPGVVQYPDNNPDDFERYSYFFGGNGQPGLPTYNPWNANDPNTPIQANEMRIVFLGSTIPPRGQAQMEMSIYVEVGTGGGTAGLGDSFLFDCGSGISTNASGMNIPYKKLSKVFISHLHADHMSDLTHIYCFGAAADRKFPLYVFGPSRSGVPNPKAPPDYYEDGTYDMCQSLRRAWRWHSESMSFIKTKNDDSSYVIPTKKTWGLPCDPVPLEGDSQRDGYSLVPIELNWKKRGEKPDDNVAYWNKETGVKITHFPVIHCRRGSIGYKLEWNGMTMIYTSDTKPEVNCLSQANNNNGKPVDVFIHEMVPPPDVWAFKQMGLKNPPAEGTAAWTQWQNAIPMTKEIQNSSHTPQGAFAYLLTQIHHHPRLTVATHFPSEDDTIACALSSVKAKNSWVNLDPQNGNIVWSFDLMTLRVFPGSTPVQQLRAVVDNWGFGALTSNDLACANAKYHNPDGSDAEMKQLDQTNHDTWIQPGEGTYCDDGY